MVKKVSVNPQLRKQLEEMVTNIYRNWKNPEHVKELLNELKAISGRDINTLVEDIVAERTRAQWASLAEREKSTTIHDLVRLVWESFTDGEFTIEKTEDSVQIYCTYCPIAEVFKEIGEKEYGLILFCATDPYIVEGFNSDIEFRRTKTLMGGDDCCDHYYAVKKQVRN